MIDRENYQQVRCSCCNETYYITERQRQEIDEQTHALLELFEEENYNSNKNNDLSK